ncbi:hypothetical protein NDU88_006546, partial [Pleurodeles waltl]
WRRGQTQKPPALRRALGVHYSISETWPTSQWTTTARIGDTGPWLAVLGTLQ